MKKFIKTFYVTFTALLLLLSINVNSQSSENDNISRPPLLTAKVDGKRSPMEITKINIDVKIVGMIAEIRMTLTFYNPHNRILEGDLHFPLPEGATVSGYALDINGKMVDGVVVEKKKGRVVFEKIVRRGIDPGLVEWVKGNNFKTRIFPIPAKGSRTISLRYISELTILNNKPLFLLPMNYNKTVKNFSLRVEVKKTDLKPIIKKGGPANFQFKQWRDSYIAETKLNNYPLSKDLLIEVPSKEIIKSKNLVRIEQSIDGNYYFAIHDLNAGFSGKRKNISNTTKHIVILWDTSDSMGPQNHKKELGLLKTFFQQFKKQIQVDLLPFNIKKEKSKHFSIKNGNIEKLLQEIKNLTYDGATSMGCISPVKGETVPDFYLLFSDGNTNFGKEIPFGLKAPLYIFSASSSANHPFLRYLAQQTGGIYFNMNQTDKKTIVKNIGLSPYSFISATYYKKGITETFPRTSRPVQSRFSLSGKLLGSAGKVIINYGINGKILKKRTYTIARKDAVNGEILKIYWAQKKIGELKIFPERNKKALIKTGKQYGLVTPGTSLIVLDNLSQYIEHEIVPPETLPEMRKKYQEIMEKRKDITKKAKQEKLEYVLKLWKKRIKWWDTTFPRPAHKVKPKKARRVRRRAEATIAVPARVSEEMAKEAEVVGGVEGGIVGGVLGDAPRTGVMRKVSKKRSRGKSAYVPAPAISLKSWDPKSPYVDKIKSVGMKKAYQTYINQKKIHRNSPSFYLDCSDYFFKNGKKEIGLLILSNIAEMEVENAALLRILAHRLSQLKYLELSKIIFEKILKIRDEEPQSFRDLALVLGQLKQYKEAVQLLYHVVANKWDRFHEIELTALMELNNFMAKARSEGVTGFDVDPRFIKLLDVDIRIVLTWDADMTDMDLWVFDPRGEKSFYSNKLSAIGGLMSCDFTEGYGPEEYLIKKAKNGEYKIKVNYYGSSSSKLLGPVTLQVDIFTHYSRKNEQRKSITLRLKEKKEVISVGVVEF